MFVFLGESVSSADQISPDQAAGTIALISGKAWVRHGEINIPTPEAETRVAPGISYSDSSNRDPGPNDHVQAGDIIVTAEDSYLKIYYRDDSIMDVGPNTVFKVSTFTMTGRSRQIYFTLLQGKVRTLVTRALEADSHYRVHTPTSAMGVHGTEWVTNSYYAGGQYRTDVTVLEGKVVVDLPRSVYGNERSQMDQVALLPGRTLSALGGGGAVAKYSTFKLNPEQIQELAAMVPNIETKRVGAIAAYNAPMLPGVSVNGRAPSAASPTEAPGSETNGRGLASNSNSRRAGDAGDVAAGSATAVQFQPTTNTAAPGIASRGVSRTTESAAVAGPITTRTPANGGGGAGGGATSSKPSQISLPAGLSISSTPGAATPLLQPNKP
ncbi:MAG: FecR domain-containing protein [Deltaproteobacteria bacterium]|nr:FecR domain-containing protein [Deltaproteobacteria bacterium]